MRYLIMAALAVVVLARPGVGAWRFAQAGPGRRYWLPMQWARLRWKWLARNTQLAPLDSNADPKTGTLKSRIRYPRARFRLDEHGWQVRVRTVPLVGRAECEQAAPHLANHWRASRVGVTQTAPGRITLRALRSDPLGRNFGQDRAPDGTYGENSCGSAGINSGGSAGIPRWNIPLEHFRPCGVSLFQRNVPAVALHSGAPDAPERR